LFFVMSLPAYASGVALLPHAMYTIEPDGLSLRKIDLREALALR
jgi:hypothetical protein